MRWLAMLVLTFTLAACRKPSPNASGSGYGVGIPRVNFSLGRGEPPSRGETTQGFRHPIERTTLDPWR